LDDDGAGEDEGAPALPVAVEEWEAGPEPEPLHPAAAAEILKKKIAELSAFRAGSQPPVRVEELPRPPAPISVKQRQEEISSDLTGATESKFEFGISSKR
jgi:hypothetical protein